jgi:Leucine-rich repeat (LRR) protein
MSTRDLDCSIRETCPKITELDLSRNLFSSLHEIAAICHQLEHLRALRLDGNRFECVTTTETERICFKLIFAKVVHLSLDNTLLSWRDIVDVCACFPALKTLSISSNEFEALDAPVSLEEFPAVTTIKLESNKLTSLASLAPLSRIPTLTQLHLKDNAISIVSPSPDQTAFPQITFLDVSHNSISDWSFITSLPPAFPALSSLRISHNPLYTNLHNPLGRELTPDDGYMLTIARLPNLKTLNFSAVTEKDRLNGETYYLSLIVQELSLKPEADAHGILEKHPRWRELCEEYGEPVVKRESDHVDPRSLAARMVTLEVELSGEAAALFGKSDGAKELLRNVPKRFNIYSVLGAVAKAFGQDSVVPGLSMSLITEDWEEADGKRVKRVLELVPETRGIGTFVEERIGRIRVEYQELQKTAFQAYEHPVTATLLSQAVVA